MDHERSENELLNQPAIFSEDELYAAYRQIMPEPEARAAAARAIAAARLAPPQGSSAFGWNLPEATLDRLTRVSPACAERVRAFREARAAAQERGRG